MGLRVIALFFDEQAHLGFEAAEAKVHAGAVGHRARQRETVGITLCRKCCQLRTAGIGQTEQFRGFIEGFADGVIQGLPQ